MDTFGANTVGIILALGGVSGGWVRFCIGAAILMLSASPLLYVVRWW